MIRKITGKERKKAGNLYCSFCRPEKVPAIWRQEGRLYNHKDGYACEAHKDLIPVDRDEHLTEADYQTWMRL